MNTLMHICCAPCANRPIAALREEGIGVTGFWFNPNIHPYTEYQARKHTLEEYAKEIAMKLVIGGTYDLRSFITHVAGNIDGRCAYCYQVRMEETARYAAEHGFDSFTTSLLISPYQNHEAIRATAQAMGARYGVEFLDRDFRPLFQAGQEFAREHGFYMQKYCGCIFSEEDRYLGRKAEKGRPAGRLRPETDPTPSAFATFPRPPKRKRGPVHSEQARVFSSSVSIHSRTSPGQTPRRRTGRPVGPSGYSTTSRNWSSISRAKASSRETGVISCTWLPGVRQSARYRARYSALLPGNPAYIRSSARMISTARSARRTGRPSSWASETAMGRTSGRKSSGRWFTFTPMPVMR